MSKLPALGLSLNSLVSVSFHLIFGLPPSGPLPETGCSSRWWSDAWREVACPQAEVVLTCSEVDVVGKAISGLVCSCSLHCLWGHREYDLWLFGAGAFTLTSLLGIHRGFLNLVGLATLGVFRKRRSPGQVDM